MVNLCAFCGAAGSSREHVWPQWIRKHAYEVVGVDHDNVARYWTTMQRPGQATVKLSKKVGNGRLSLVGRHVCKQCNEGWMSSLEMRVAPLLRPMIEGEPTEIGPEGVRVLRAWATKTALNFGYQAKGLEAQMPENAGRALFSARAIDGVPPGTEVWIAGYDDPRCTFAYRHMLSRSLGSHPKTGEIHRLLRVVFVAGSVAFYVRVPDSTHARGMARTETLPQFTPLFDLRKGRSIAWRRGGLSDADISAVFNRHIEAGITPNEQLQSWHAPPGADDLQ